MKNVMCTAFAVHLELRDRKLLYFTECYSNQVRRNVVKKPKNRPGDMSLILSLADVLSKSNWLSKDIIFLFTNKSVERWLDDYNHAAMTSHIARTLYVTR